MSIFLKTLDRCGQPVFIVLAFMTLPFWFPLLLAWVIIDPPYRWASWQKRGIKSHMIYRQSANDHPNQPNECADIY
jgi:hypothetical protein